MLNCYTSQTRSEIIRWQPPSDPSAVIEAIWPGECPYHRQAHSTAPQLKYDGWWSTTVCSQFTVSLTTNSQTRLLHSLFLSSHFHSLFTMIFAIAIQFLLII
jgi:hypothetical protein